MSSKRGVISFFVIGGIVLGGSVAGLPLFAKANKWDGGEFMMWLEESPMFRYANKFIGSKRKKPLQDDDLMDNEEDE